MSTATEINSLWTSVLASMAPQLVNPVMKTWFDSASPVEITDDGVLVIAVESSFAREWFEGRYSPHLCSALSSVSGRNMDVRIVVDPSAVTRIPEGLPHEEPAIVAEPVAQPKQVAAGPSGLNPRLTFATFVVGESNRLAATAALAVADEPGTAFNPLFIYGGSGLGKTHLLHAIGNHVEKHYPEKKVLYVTSEQFTNDFIASLEKRKMDAFRQRYRPIDVLLLDDVQSLKGREGTLDEFFNTFNELTSLGKAVILSSDRPPKDINIEERYRSRFASGLPVDVAPPNLETRVAILRRWFDSEKLPVDDDALLYIAEAASSCNIREMEGAKTRIIAWASLSKKDLDISLIKEATRDFFPDHSLKPISIQLIQREVCRFFQVSHAELIGSKRSQQIVYPRQIAMYLARELTDMSLPKIGENFGGRDHTTVMHATKKIQELMSAQREVYIQVQQLTNAIKQHN
jgi:chromosomal replication initiator protein